MNIKNALVLVVVIGASVAGLTTCSGGAHCKGSRVITACEKLGTCSQEFESSCN